MPITCWGDISPLMAEYHDREWGMPCHDDRELFERLMLEGFQAGLSWEIVLKRREGFYAAFEGWDPTRIAAYGPEDSARLLADPRIIRNRLKVEGAEEERVSVFTITDRVRDFRFVHLVVRRREYPRTPRATVVRRCSSNDAGI